MAARKRRLLTSADAMFQQRECFSGVMEGKFKFERANPAVLHMMQADVFKGMWSCCRKINANDIGCTQATGHNIKKPRCAQCGQHFNLVTGKHKGYTADKDEACLFHPGTLETSRFGGTIWTCCRSSGYEDSSLDQKVLEGEYRWGCQRGPHVPIQVPKMERSKILDALSVQVLQASLQGNRTTGVSCYTRLRYKDSEFTTKRSYDPLNPRWEGLDKPFHIQLDASDIVQPKITFELTDVFHSDAQKEVLATFDHIGNEITLENAIARFEKQVCIMHPGTYCKDRQSREKGGTRCTGTCKRPHCENQCARTPHSRNSNLDYIGCICASKTCPYPCYVKGCTHPCEVPGCDELCGCEVETNGFDSSAGGTTRATTAAALSLAPGGACCRKMMGTGISTAATRRKAVGVSVQYRDASASAVIAITFTATSPRLITAPAIILVDTNAQLLAASRAARHSEMNTMRMVVMIADTRNASCLVMYRLPRLCMLFVLTGRSKMPGCKELCDVKDHHAKNHTRHLCHKLKHACPETCSAVGCDSRCCQTLEEDKSHTASSRHRCLQSSKGCVARCSMPSCDEKCSHFDHFHSASSHVISILLTGSQNQDDAMHQCSGTHSCHEACDLCRTGQQAAKNGAKFARVVCGMAILPGMRRHDGMHVCGGEHIDEKKNIGRCANKCSHAGCDFRCIMTANSERKKIHENCYCAEHTVCGGKCERRVECDRPCMKPAWHMKGHAVFPSCLPKSSTFFTICDCLDKHERQTSLDRKVKRKHKAIQGKQDPRKHAQQVFDQFDKCPDLSTSLSSDAHARDHSGSIEFEELMELLALMETAVSEEEAIRIMQVADRDGSGQISFDEFCEVIGLGSSESDASWKGLMGQVHLGTEGVGEGTGVGGCNVGMGIGHIRHLARWIHLSLRLKKWLLRLKLNKKNLQACDKAVEVNSMAAESSTVKPKEVKSFRLSLVHREVGLSPLVEKLKEKRVPNDAHESHGKSSESHRLLKFISDDVKVEDKGDARRDFKWSRHQSSILPDYLPPTKREQGEASLEAHRSSHAGEGEKTSAKQVEEEKTRRTRKPRRPPVASCPQRSSESSLKEKRRSFLFDSFLAEFQQNFENLDEAARKSEHDFVVI
ncbi:hypothetical protein GUITHDRAFT_135079 [Guillardia theta CCMP2712]|uniref:EF-hand domain-containing protein n=1 Tax=Guillardia theta (strain CCMP2712) TaxID=905079 RepID=L1JQD1_GUITC|nr:hypothetical protein GUITHDRAFT_135079 [Guillardia theta CCMP2712]EKX50390.1 hypothetical protein GUITHDRAFT_135079 [Guillardia theta CCMP2712]|eukprot:XP_005837370.1 hypothetical protein GUITHDRAFT_135079 [Guillardia theta CCMP2712]